MSVRLSFSVFLVLQVASASTWRYALTCEVLTFKTRGLGKLSEAQGRLDNANPWQEHEVQEKACRVLVMVGIRSSRTQCCSRAHAGFVLSILCWM